MKFWGESRRRRSPSGRAGRCSPGALAKVNPAAWFGPNVDAFKRFQKATPVEKAWAAFVWTRIAWVPVDGLQLAPRVFAFARLKLSRTAKAGRVAVRTSVSVAELFVVLASVDRAGAVMVAVFASDGPVGVAETVAVTVNVTVPRGRQGDGRVHVAGAARCGAASRHPPPAHVHAHSGERCGERVGHGRAGRGRRTALRRHDRVGHGGPGRRGGGVVGLGDRQVGRAARGSRRRRRRSRRAAGGPGCRCRCRGRQRGPAAAGTSARPCWPHPG